MGLLILIGCTKPKEREVNITSAPTITCEDIVVSDREETLDLMKYCKLSDGANLTLADTDIDMSIGEHEVSYTLNVEGKNAYSVGSIKYTVEKYVPKCSENSHYDEEKDTCVCDEGYVEEGRDEKDNQIVACKVKAKPTPTPKPTQAPISTPTPNYTQPVNTPQPTPVPTPIPTPVSTPKPTQQPQSSGGTHVCTPQVNSQEALDRAFNECVNICNSHPSCEVYYNGSAYVAEWH